MISASLNYLRDGEDAIVTVAIGGVLLLASPLLIPSFLVLGYLTRVSRQTAEGDDRPPVFEAWADLLVEGLKAFAVTFVYSLLPLAILTVAAVFGIGAAVIGSGNGVGGLFGGLIGGLLALLLVVVALAVALAGVYVTPAAVAAVADSGRVGDGFAVGTLWGIVSKRTYAVGWLTAVAVVFAGSVAIGLLSVIPIIGTIAGFFVQFYAIVAAAAIIGWTWTDVRPVATNVVEPDTANRPTV